MRDEMAWREGPGLEGAVLRDEMRQRGDGNRIEAKKGRILRDEMRERGARTGAEAKKGRFLWDEMVEGGRDRASKPKG